VLVGQLLGFYKSLQLDLMPDAPSVNGAISRVVQGVNIYPVEANKSIINY
jgi:tagatose-6-phosphate ketose/aldose isomerase